MSTRPIGVDLPHEERRAYPRRRLDRLAYVDFGPENGGILIDVSEGGLNFQVVGALIEGHSCHVRFLLPGTDTVIEANGKITWSNASKRGGGLQFVDISEEARRHLREWIAMEPVVAAPSDTPDEGAADGPGMAPLNVTPIAAESVEQTRLAAALAAAARIAPSSVPAPSRRPPLAGPIAVAAPVRSVVEMTKQPSTAPAPRPVPPVPQLRAAAGRADTLVHAAPKREAAATEPEPQPALRPRFVGAVLFLLLAALASQSGRFAYLLTGSGHSSAPSAASPAPQGSFRVDITDASGRHFTLSSDAAETQAAAAIIAAPAPKAQARSNAAEAPASSPAAAAPSNPAPARAIAAAPSAPIAAPRTPQTQPVSAAAAEPPPVIIYTPAAAEPIGAPLSVAPAAPAAQVQPAAPAVVSNFVPAGLIHRVNPPYAPKSGTVQVKFRIGTDGIPEDLALVSGDHGLGGLAMDAIKKWRYQPATLNGRIVESETTVSMQINVKQ